MSALGRPRDALARFTRAAELDPMYYMYPMYRCLMLQDLGQNDDAARACARMRTLTRNNHWGAFVTSWLETAAWRPAGSAALEHRGRKARARPGGSGVLPHRSHAHAADWSSRRAKRCGTSSRLTRHECSSCAPNVELAEHGPAGLRAYLDDSGTAALSSSSVGVEAMRLYHVAGDLKNARQALDALRAAPGYQEIDLYDVTQVRVGYSSALICAGVLLGER